MSHIWEMYLNGVFKTGSTDAIHPCFDYLRFAAQGQQVALYVDGNLVADSNGYQDSRYFTPETILRNWYAVKTGQITFEVVD